MTFPVIIQGRDKECGESAKKFIFTNEISGHCVIAINRY